MSKQPLEKWLNDGKHLPEFLRDFHEAKQFFKVMHAVQELPEGMPDISWIEGHAYAIDRFLWYLARRGYTLQKNRSKIEFEQFPRYDDVIGPGLIDVLLQSAKSNYMDDSDSNDTEGDKLMTQDGYPIALIAAAADNQVIGHENSLPWHLPEDFRHFKATTLRKPVVMGRKTYDSIGRPLPGRTNIVITRQDNWSAPGVMVANSLTEALEMASQAVKDESLAEEIMILGGEQIYKMAMPLADRIYLTRVSLTPKGDAFFPDIPDDEWNLVSSEDSGPETSVPHCYQVFERVKK